MEFTLALEFTFSSQQPKMYTKDIHFLHIDKRRGNYYNDS